jgi:hypothetical protein
MDGDLLLRLGGGQFRLPYGQRDLPPGGTRARHRHFLCDQDRGRRRHGPSLFGYLIGTGSIAAVAAGYAIAAILMLIAAAVELAFGVDAEQRSLESITEPLSLLS